MIRNVLAALLLLASFEAAAQDAPFGLGAVTLGASVAEYQAAYPDHECQNNKGQTTFPLKNLRSGDDQAVCFWLGANRFSGGGWRGGCKGESLPGTSPR